MSEPVILFVKPKAISARDKKALQSAGVIVIEVENVADVKLVRAHAELSGSELLRAAAYAMNHSTWGSEVMKSFGQAICEAIEAQKPRSADDA